MTVEEAIRLWKLRVFDNAASIDPDDDHDWYDLAYGFFLGLGIHPHVALELSTDDRVQLGDP